MQTFPGYSDVRALRQEPWGSVYAARQDSVGRAVEIHVVGEHADPDARSALVGAVRAAAGLGLATIAFCVDLDPDGAYFVVERPGGSSLDEVMRVGDRTSRLSLAGALLRTWEAVHDAGLLAGSVRPEAVRIRADGTPCVSLCPYVQGADVSGFHADAIPWLPAWVGRGEQPYDTRAERAAVATLVAAVLTGAPAHEAVAALGSSDVPAETAELLTAIAAGVGNDRLGAAAGPLDGASQAGLTARERDEADVLVASLYDDRGSEDAPETRSEEASAQSEDAADGDDAPDPCGAQGDAPDPDGAQAAGDGDLQGRETFAGELNLDAMIDLDALPASADADGAPDESAPVAFGTIAPAEHAAPDAAERMLAHLRRVEEWIHELRP